MLFKPNIKKIIRNGDTKRLRRLLARERNPDVVDYPLLYDIRNAAVPSLITCLEDEQTSDRAAELIRAITEKAEIGEENRSDINPNLRLLICALNNENERVKIQAARILKTLPGLGISPTAQQKKKVGTLIRKLQGHTDPIPVLLEILAEGSHATKRRGVVTEMGMFRRWIVKILGGFWPDPRIVSALGQALLADKDGAVYLGICNVLKSLGPVKEAVPPLAKAVKLQAYWPSDNKFCTLLVLGTYGEFAADVLGSYGSAAKAAIPNLIQAWQKWEDGEYFGSALANITDQYFDTPEEYAEWWKDNGRPTC